MSQEERKEGDTHLKTKSRDVGTRRSVKIEALMTESDDLICCLHLSTHKKILLGSQISSKQ